MESNLPLFSLPFVDSEAFAEKNKGQGGVYDELQHAHGSLLGGDDVLAHILTADGPLEEPDLNGPTTLHCEICNKQFDNAKKYYGHLRVHSGVNVWVCDKCPDQKFTTKQQLMKHGLVHKPLERVWRCPQCTKAFEALWQLQQHLFAKHFNYRPHKCDICEKAFHKPSDLKKHKDVHDENRVHGCTECDRKFKDKSNLKRHMLRHNGEKPFSCPGCGNKFKQVASMRRHAKNCRHVKDNNTEVHNCRVCGMSFQQKSALSEHCARHHPNPTIDMPKEKKTMAEIADANRTVENIVDDILSAEDEYMTMTSQGGIMNQYTQPPVQTDNTDTLMQIEFLKDMNQLHTLDDELFYNDIDFDSFQTSHIFNTNEIDYNTNDRNAEIFFDFTENKSVDQDFMNALYHVKGDGINDELLNVADIPIDAVPDNSTVSVNECATIFETDVDLEASTNLAANLNQLIGENSVQYISTEDDDTFIISLNSEIDAEQLTDMLNIGVELIDDNNKIRDDENALNIPINETTDNVEPKVVNVVEEPKQQEAEVLAVLIEKEPLEKKTEGTKKKKKDRFVCKRCKKVFTRRYNFRSHIATHEPSLRRYKCSECDCTFSYYSSLKRHAVRHRPPAAAPVFSCQKCSNIYKAKWMLKQHISRDHERKLPFACDEVDCERRFYKKCDLELHKRFHSGERPYVCEVCARAFTHVSHLRRHTRTVDCTKVARKSS